MSTDLTTSAIDRQNILNNPYALGEIEKATGIQGIPFEGQTVVLKEQVAAFFEVTVRTVENYLESHGVELGQNGYAVLEGNRLRKFKLAIEALHHPEADFGIIAKTARLGVFDFRAFLNLAMLMRESSRAGLLRRAILDIVIDTINRRTGGATRYINQRDEDFIHAAFAEESLLTAGRSTCPRASRGTRLCGHAGVLHGAAARLRCLVEPVAGRRKTNQRDWPIAAHPDPHTSRRCSPASRR